MRAVLLVASLLLLLAASTGPEVRAALQPSGFSVNIQPGTSQVSFTLSIFQNLTGIVRSFVLPQVHGVLVGYNSTTAAAALQSAVKVKSPSADLKNLRVEAFSTPWSNTTQSQWLNVSLSFGIEEGALSNSQGVQFDAAWRSFEVQSGISLAGLELNNIGSAYLLPTAEVLTGFSNSKTVTYTYHVNGLGVPLSSLPERVAPISVLNFSSLAVPLSEWTPTYNYTSNTVTFSLRSLPTYGLEVLQTVVEAQPEQIAYKLSYSFHGAIFTAPLRSTVNGDRIVVVFGDSQETLMASLIVSTSILAVGTTFYERQVLSRIPGKRTKR